jgi:hypothetical protein
MSQQQKLSKLPFVLFLKVQNLFSLTLNPAPLVQVIPQENLFPSVLVVIAVIDPILSALPLESSDYS